jgi:hypothetical protein
MNDANVCCGGPKLIFACSGEKVVTQGRTILNGDKA